MEFKLLIVIHYQNIFQINQARLKYQFPWQPMTLSNGIHNMLIMIDLGAFKDIVQPQ